jgi:hypothetical protein
LSSASSAGASSISVNSTQGMTIGGSVTLSSSSGSQTIKVIGINTASGSVSLENPPALLVGFGSGATVTANPSIPVNAATTALTAAATTSSPISSISASPGPPRQSAPAPGMAWSGLATASSSATAPSSTTP